MRQFTLISLAIFCIGSFPYDGIANSIFIDGINAHFLEYQDSGEPSYRTEIHDPGIKTLILHTSNSELEAPVIDLGGNKQLILRFDDLGEDIRDMYYEFEHCTFDWQSSELDLYDYQEGYDNDLITDYKYSFNALTPYTHFKLAFPNDRISLIQSGNYVIRVYADNDKTKKILTARFMVVEKLASIRPNVQFSRVVSEREYNQEVDFAINLNKVPSLNPYAEIELVVMQNDRWDNMKYGVKPSFVNGQDLVYNYQDALTFDGINEHRKVDAKSVKYRTEEVAAVTLEENGYHMYLAPDKSRAFLKYSLDGDINGKFLIQNDDMLEPHLESDYVWMHFVVPVDALLGVGKMYLFGQISNWQLTEEFEMEFNQSESVYQSFHLIKQGYYNYMYLWEDAATSTVSTDYTEGNHSETENDYQVFVYFKDPRSYCYRLVGYKLFNSSSQ